MKIVRKIAKKNIYLSCFVAYLGDNLLTLALRGPFDDRRLSTANYTSNKSEQEQVLEMLTSAHFLSSAVRLYEITATTLGKAYIKSTILKRLLRHNFSIKCTFYARRC